MDDSVTLPKATQRFLAAAHSFGLAPEVREFPQGTKTAREAAEAVGCAVSAIVKSLVFVVDNRPVIALVPGDRRLDPSLLAAAAGGERVGRASLEQVRDSTGYAAGGTPPFGYPEPLLVFADRSLTRHDVVWAAAGTPTTVFPIELQRLIAAADARWADLTRADPRQGSSGP